MMKKDTSYDPKLHAYIDNELDMHDRVELLEEMQDDGQLRDQVCELRRVKDLVQQAYYIPPPPTQLPGGSGHGRLRTLLARCAVLVLMLLMSFAGGWLTHSGQDASIKDHLAALGALRLQYVADHHERGTPSVLLHVATDNPEKLASTLKEANYLLNEGRNRDIKVEVVANGGGLKLLEVNDNAHIVRQIRHMIDRHPNLHFVACGITVHKLEKAGVPVDLIKDVRIAPSAATEIVRRLREGWYYINI